jgi:hypothetical protein
MMNNLSSISQKWYDRIYVCIQKEDNYKCKLFYSKHAVELYKLRMKNNDMKFIYMCYLSPLILDPTILKFKLNSSIHIIH